MTRIAGVNLPKEKPIQIALTYIYGIGRPLALKILAEAKIDPGKRTHTLGRDEVEKIKDIIEKNYSVEGELRTEIHNNIKRLKEIGSWRGNRHTRRLPVRGQRTKTNARTKRGKRVTVGSGRKPTGQKT